MTSTICCGRLRFNGSATFDFSGYVEETMAEVGHSGRWSVYLIDIGQRPGYHPPCGRSPLAPPGARASHVAEPHRNNLDNDAAAGARRVAVPRQSQRFSCSKATVSRKVWQQVIERFGEDVVG